MSNGPEHSDDDAGNDGNRTKLGYGLIVGLSDLLPGDILLFRSNTATAKGISAVTGSPYSHAAIHLGDGEIGESNTPGIGIRELTDQDAKKSQIGVLRSQMGFSAERASAVRAFVTELVEKKVPYDFKGFSIIRARAGFLTGSNHPKRPRVPGPIDQREILYRTYP